MRSFKVNISVLTIIGHDTMASLVCTVVERVSALTTPMIEDLIVTERG